MQVETCGVTMTNAIHGVVFLQVSALKSTYITSLLKKVTVNRNYQVSCPFEASAPWFGWKLAVLPLQISVQLASPPHLRIILYQSHAQLLNNNRQLWTVSATLSTYVLWYRDRRPNIPANQVCEVRNSTKQGRVRQYLGRYVCSLACDAGSSEVRDVKVQHQLRTGLRHS